MASTVSKTKLVRPLRGGQVTIPAEFRRSLGIDQDTMLCMTLADGELIVRPIKFNQKAEGSPWLRELYEYFAPVREEIRAMGISEEELYADIDAAIAEVRAERRASQR